MASSQQQQNRSQILQAASIIVVAFIASRILGIVRDAVINFYFDIDSLEANAYFIASRFPEIIFYVIAGGALGSAFIPTFAGYFARDDSAGAWRLFSAVINLVTVATIVVAGLTAIFTPQIINLFYPDLMATNPQQLPEMTAALMRVMLLSPIIFGVSGVIMGALNARQHFLLPAIAPIIYNVGIIIGAVLFAPNVMGLAVGTVGGALGHLLIQLPALKQKGGFYKPTAPVRTAGVRQVLTLMGPRVLGLSFGQINHLVTQFLAQSMVLGSIPALGFAWRVMIMPQGIIGQALGIASFPTFATLAAEKNIPEMRRIVADTLRLIFFLGLPATVLLFILRRPIIRLLFERGQFDAESTEFVAWALLFYAGSLLGLAAIEVISRAFYALEDTKTPVLAGFIQLLVMVVTGLWFSRVLFPLFDWLPLGGLALGYTFSTLVETSLLLWWLRVKMGGLDGRHLLAGLWRMGLATLVMGGGSWLIERPLTSSTTLLQLLIVSTVGGLLYLASSILLHIEELHQLLNHLLTILRRHR